MFGDVCNVPVDGHRMFSIVGEGSHMQILYTSEQCLGEFL